MKIKNTLKSHTTEELRRMTVWVCQQVGISTRRLSVTFMKSRSSWSGMAWGKRRFGVRLGRCEYPCSFTRHGRWRSYADDWEVLVVVTAHEAAHVGDWRDGTITNEPSADRQSLAVLDKFRERRSELLTEWTASPPAKVERAKPIKLTAQEKRAAAAEAKLAEWQRKLKLAQTKVKQYRTKCRYYQRAAAVKAAKKTSENLPL